MRTTLVLGDFHVPFMDMKAIRKMMAEIEGNKDITTVVFNGDMVDFYHISRFLRDPRRKGDIFSESNQARMIMRKVVDVLPNVDKVVFNEGNHEYRLTKYLWRQAPELIGAKDFLNVKSILALEEDYDNFEHHKYMDFKNGFMDGGVLITHTLREGVSQEAGYTASLAMRKLGTSIVIGHTHRLAMVTKRMFGRILQGAEGGTFSELYPEYARFPNWQQGYVTIDIDGRKHKIYTHIII